MYKEDIIEGARTVFSWIIVLAFWYLISFLFVAFRNSDSIVEFFQVYWRILKIYLT